MTHEKDKNGEASFSGGDRSEHHLARRCASSQHSMVTLSHTEGFSPTSTSELNHVHHTINTHLTTAQSPGAQPITACGSCTEIVIFFFFPFLNSFYYSKHSTRFMLKQEQSIRLKLRSDITCVSCCQCERHMDLQLPQYIFFLPDSEV